MKTKETYARAHARLLVWLKAEGWTTSSHNLKIPWAISSEDNRLWFHPQAIYLNAHSLFVDARGMSGESLLRIVDAALHSGVGYNL